MSVQPVWIPGSVRNETHFANPPRGVRYLIGTVSANKFDPRKKIPLSAHLAPAVRENVLHSLHKLPQNLFLEFRTIKIS